MQTHRIDALPNEIIHLIIDYVVGPRIVPHHFGQYYLVSQQWHNVCRSIFVRLYYAINVSKWPKLKIIPQFSTMIHVGNESLVDDTVFNICSAVKEITIYGTNTVDINKVLQNLDMYCSARLNIVKITGFDPAIHTDLAKRILPPNTNINAQSMHSGIVELTFGHSNKITTIPYLSALETLMINYNSNIKQISHLTTLKTLNIAHTNYGFNDIHTLTNLTILDIYGNHTINSRILSELTNLTDLNIGQTLFTDQFAIMPMTNLTSLSLRDINYAPVITTLTRLVSIDLDHNQSFTDYQLMSLTQLNYLSLWESNITDIGIFTLTNLSNLVLNHNITVDCIRRLTNLIELDITWANYQVRNSSFDIKKIIDDNDD